MRKRTEKDPSGVPDKMIYLIWNLPIMKFGSDPPAPSNGDDRQVDFCGDNRGAGTFLINESNPLCLKDIWPRPVSSNALPRLAAAYTGYSRLSQHKDVKRGYIGSVKKSYNLFIACINTEITTEITVENELLGFIIITGKILSNEKLLLNVKWEFCSKIMEEKPRSAFGLF